MGNLPLASEFIYYPVFKQSTDYSPGRPATPSMQGFGLQDPPRALVKNVDNGPDGPLRRSEEAEMDYAPRRCRGTQTPVAAVNSDPGEFTRV